MWVCLPYVIGVKKPAGTTEEIQKRFGCRASLQQYNSKLHNDFLKVEEEFKCVEKKKLIW
ncbi:hypothetical protein C1H46_029228 [Malus baccata]|uniref:Uncharacterized protein n=1 Tax=Malus baccata TaxID=106549 RepID=A0A540LFH4_MALBA|nr:hypothetical protein C1H46_029228 [Malus baccata]